MEPNIKVTDETRLVLESYLQKQYARKAKRLAAKEAKVKEKKETYPFRESPQNIIIVENENIFQDYIDALGRLKDGLSKHLSISGKAVKVGKKDEKRVESAARYLETAIGLLDSLKKD